MRPSHPRKATDAGKHVYCEKPISEGLEEAVEIARHAQGNGVKNGILHGKLDFPGLRKPRRLRDAGFLGRILSIRGEFGYWVFEGDWQDAQRPSWNYRADAGGGIVSDMLCHWRYVLDNVVAPVTAVSCRTAARLPERVDEAGARYAAYATFELVAGIVAQISSSRTDRVRRNELVDLPDRRDREFGGRGSAPLHEPAQGHQDEVSGTRTSAIPASTPMSGRRSPTTRSSTTASRSGGKGSCAT